MESIDGLILVVAIALAIGLLMTGRRDTYVNNYFPPPAVEAQSGNGFLNVITALAVGLVVAGFLTNIGL